MIYTHQRGQRLRVKAYLLFLWNSPTPHCLPGYQTAPVVAKSLDYSFLDHYAKLTCCTSSNIQFFKAVCKGITHFSHSLAAPITFTP